MLETVANSMVLLHTLLDRKINWPVRQVLIYRLKNAPGWLGLFVLKISFKDDLVDSTLLVPLFKDVLR